MSTSYDGRDYTLRPPANPRLTPGLSPLIPLIFIVLLFVIVGRRQADKKHLPTPPLQPTEDAERAERKRDLERVKQDHQRNQKRRPTAYPSEMVQ